MVTRWEIPIPNAFHCDFTFSNWCIILIYKMAYSSRNKMSHLMRIMHCFLVTRMVTRWLPVVTRQKIRCLYRNRLSFLLFIKYTVNEHWHTLVINFSPFRTITWCNLLPYEAMMLLMRPLSLEYNVFFTRAENSSNVSSWIISFIALRRNSFFTKAKTFSIGLNSGDLSGIGKRSAPTSSCAALDFAEFWLGSPSCNHVFELFPHFWNNLEKFSLINCAKDSPFSLSYWWASITPWS